MSSLTIRPAPSAAEYVRKALRCGHWRDSTEHTRHQAFLEHIETGTLIGYPMHDGGNDRNGARNFAAAAGSVCGCTFVTPRGRKRSRTRVEPSGFSLEQAIREQVEHAQYVTRLTDARERLVAALFDRIDGDRSRRACGTARTIARRLAAVEDALARSGVDVAPVDFSRLRVSR